MTAATSTYSARQRRALAAMGIPVWVRRGVGSEAASSGAVPPEPDRPREADAGQVQTRQQVGHTQGARDLQAVESEIESAGADAIVRIDLSCFHAGPLALLAVTATQADRRLAKDLVLAGAGGLTDTWRRWQDAPAPLRFRWPQTAQGPSGADACRLALGAFIRGMSDRHGVRLLLLAGEEPAQLVDVDPADSWQPGESAGVRTLTIPALADLRRDSSLKRQLWLSILNSR